MASFLVESQNGGQTRKCECKVYTGPISYIIFKKYNL